MNIGKGDNYREDKNRKAFHNAYVALHSHGIRIVRLQQQEG